MLGLRLLTFGLPFFAMPGVESPYFEPKTMLFLAGSWGIIFWHTFKKQVALSVGWRNPATFWLAAWVVGVSLYKFHWLYLNRSRGESAIYNSYAWLACVNVITAFMLAYVLSQHLRLDKHLHQLTEWVCLSAALSAGYGLLQYFRIDQFYFSEEVGSYTYQIQGGLGNPGYLAIFLAVIFPLHFIFSPRRYIAYAALSLWVIYLTHTNYAFAIAALGCGASFLSQYWARLSVWLKGLSIAGTTASVYAMGAYGFNILKTDERPEIWALAFQKMQSSYAARAPSFTGYGLDSFPILMGERFFWAHNEWIHASIEIGVIGCLLMLGMAAISTKSGWVKAQTSILQSGWFGVWVAFLAASLIHFPLHIAPIAFIGLIAWAVTERTEIADA